MRRFEWPMSPLILGFLMGPMFEQSMRQSLAISNGTVGIFFTRPITAVCIAAAVLVLVVTIVIRVRAKAAAQFMADGVNEV